MDKIIIRNLRAETYLGVYDWEQRTPRPVLIDLELASDVARAARTDHIGDALDYAAVSERLIADISCQRCALIETLAERCARLLREEFGVPWLRLWLRKPGALGNEIEVGLVIERGIAPGNASAGAYQADGSGGVASVRHDHE